MRLGPGNPAGPRVPLTRARRAAADLTPATETTPPRDQTLEPVTAALATVEDTKAFGARLAGVLRAGDLIVLSGPLGAGKTALVQGIGAGLGVSGRVASPTFVIARVHPGPLPLVHVDAYRLASLAEVDDLDLDMDSADVVTAVEWGAGLAEQLADARLEIAIARAEDSEDRTVVLTPFGGDWAARLATLGG
jgi:tRNA threonylcarbamoyladenosine biosynthesis protein TsaE